MQFVAVIFSDDSVEVIPTVWMDGIHRACWPSGYVRGSKNCNLKGLIGKAALPQDNWELWDVSKVICESGKYFILQSIIYVTLILN